MTLNIQLKSHHFNLHPCGAMHWRQRDTLIISDVHLGKISHFRKHGLAVPRIALTENFARLEMVANQYQAATICFLGDLFHSKHNEEWEFFSEWVFGRNEEMLLVTGNHDVLSAEKYAEAGIKPISQLQSGPFILTHEPETHQGLFNICGHIHPGIQLRGLGRQSVGLACFFEEKNRLILPAFGNFTGKWYLDPETAERVFVLAGNEVKEIPMGNT